MKNKKYKENKINNILKWMALIRKRANVIAMAMIFNKINKYIIMLNESEEKMK